MENILYPLLSLIPAILNVGILVYLLFFVFREKTTEIFSFFVLALILWQAEDTIVRLCSTSETALFWDRFLCIGWAGVAPIAFHFSCQYTSLKALSSRFSLFCIYSPAIFFYLMYIASSQPTLFSHQEGWGWILMPREGTLDGIHRFTISLYILGALFLLFRFAFTMKGSRQKKMQAYIIFFGMLLPTVQGIITQIIFPVVFNKPDIPVTSSVMTLFSVATILSIRKYRLFNVSDSIHVETVLANLKNIVIVLSPKQQIMYMNPYAREVFGIEKPGEGAIEVNCVFPSPELYQSFIGEVFLPSMKREQVGNYATVFQTSQGKQIDVLLSAERIISNNQVQGLLVVASDVTVLSKALNDLETSNKELERFAYVASHDLQEPLRKVSYFLQLLEIKYKDKIDPVANNYIDTAVNAASQMRQLIQDLLAYSYLSNGAEQNETVNLNKVVEKATKALDLQIEETGATITAGVLPEFHRSNETQMLQVVQNLLSNSLKYRGDKKPIIEIFADNVGDHWRIAVKDNGIGIATTYHEKVFAVFQRLHGKNQYPGTGIGLSICKKVVEQHGGRIWIESNPEGGCTFFFTIPKHRHTNRKFAEAIAGEMVKN